MQFKETLAEFRERYTDNVKIKGREKNEMKNISTYLRKKGIAYANIMEIQYYVNELARETGILWSDEVQNQFIRQAKNELKGQPLTKENPRAGLHEFAENFLLQLKERPLLSSATTNNFFSPSPVPPSKNIPFNPSENLSTKKR